MVMPWLIFLALAALVVYLATRVIVTKSTNSDFGFLKKEEGFIRSILALAAYLTKADSKVSSTEQIFILRQLEKDFNPKQAGKYLSIYKTFLKKKISVNRVTLSINSNLNLSAKIQLLYFLVGLIASDGVLTREEEHKIFTIARLIRVPYSSLRSILGMFNFRQESAYSKDNSKTNGKSKTRSSRSKLDKAYTILGVTANVSNDKLKRAYRKLAKIHHPDKVAHLGTIYQEKATEKFQLIVSAYDLIKENREIA